MSQIGTGIGLDSTPQADQICPEKGANMRVVLAILAFFAAVSSLPAKAAIWTFAIEGVVTGQTRLTDIAFGGPFERFFNESYVYSNVIQIQSFATSGVFNEVYPLLPCGNLPQHGQRAPYHYCFYSGTLAFSGNAIVGSGLRVHADGAGCNAFCGVDTDLTAPAFSATFLYSSDGSAPVPEPTTWAMMLIGFGMAGMALRKVPLRPAAIRVRQ